MSPYVILKHIQIFRRNAGVTIFCLTPPLETKLSKSRFENMQAKGESPNLRPTAYAESFVQLRPKSTFGLLPVQVCYTNSPSLFWLEPHGVFKSIYLQLRPPAFLPSLLIPLPRENGSATQCSAVSRKHSARGVDEQKR
jgi:hypothetical protein